MKYKIGVKKYETYLKHWYYWDLLMKYLAGIFHDSKCKDIFQSQK